MNCHLCKEHKELRRSHIVSEAFWTGIYNDKHLALPISIEGSSTPIQKGIREKLLCADCEVKLSQWESILKKDLIDLGNLSSNFLSITKVKANIIKVENIRYTAFKLGVLSLLWRMSISSHPLYKGYDLGVYNEKIRLLLHQEITMPAWHFPIMISRYELNRKFSPDIQMGFPKGRYDHFTVQTLMVWGHSFTIFVNDKQKPTLPKEIYLSESGEVYIDVRNAVELATRNSALARLFDEDVTKFYQR